MRFQATLKQDLSFSGKGLHTGVPVRMTLKPAAPGEGIVFRRLDLPGAPRIHAAVEKVTATERGTVVAEGGASVSTIEHLLGAFYGLGVDNALVELDGPEVPIGDGSALPYVQALAGQGLAESGEPCPVLCLGEEITVEEKGRRIRAVPSGELLVHYMVDYGHPQLGRQSLDFKVTPDSFASEIAGARTFCFDFEIEAMRRAGLVKGGDLQCALVIGQQGLLNPPLRFPDEFVRHKILDFLGDLSLLGRPVKAEFFVEKSGHTFNVTAVREFLSKQATLFRDEEAG